jgi:uncharacterized membrane protein (DUF106 family)
MAVDIPLTFTLIAVAMAIGVNAISSVGRRFLTNIERLRRLNAELKEYRRELTQAIRNRDRKDEEKLRKKQKQMNQLQAEMSRQNLKPTLLFMLPLFGLWFFVSGYVGADTIVATSPIPLDLGLLSLTGKPVLLDGQLVGYTMNFFWWYLIASFAFSSMMAKAAGVTLD